MRHLLPRLLLMLVALATTATVRAQTPGDRAEADAALNNTFTLQGVTGKQARLPGGGYDWDYRGPRNDPEWAWFFNRHGYFIPTIYTWEQTHEQRYLDWVLTTLDDWIIQHPAPGHMTFSAAWRPLEAARRILGPWLLIEEKLANVPAFTPDRRARFLASIHAHGEQLRHHHALSGNHLITEMLALTQLCLAFPAESETEEWLAYSLNQLTREYDAQVYPDGAYKELTTHYQRVVAVNYQILLNLLTKAGRLKEARDWQPRVERLWHYLWAVQKPNGSNPLNNDSDFENTTQLLSATASSLANSPPFETIALPYAGQIIFRSGDPGRPQWAFFDRGPRGTAHQHDDRLQFSLSLGQRDFLVDNGRYTYVPGPWRDYFSGPTGHNVLLLDGQGGEPGPDSISAPPPTTGLSQGEYWEASTGNSRFTLNENPRAADWQRTVINLRGDGWIVLDRVISFGPRQLDTLWHWHPDCVVQPNADGTLTITNQGQALTLAHAGTTPQQTLTQIRGSELPVQGWHSNEFNLRRPATCTRATQSIHRPTLNAWLFTPGRQPAAIHIASATPSLIVLNITHGDTTEQVSLTTTPSGQPHVERTPQNTHH